MSTVNCLSAAIDAVERVEPMRVVGSVAALRGLTVLVDDLPLPVGSLVSIGSPAAISRDTPSYGEVVGFTREHAVVMLLGQTNGIRPGDRVVGEEVRQTVGMGVSVLGRVLDGLGRPIDGNGALHELVHVPLNPEPISALRRRRITQRLTTGLRAVDLMTTVGRGQRLGIFAGPGVGKSTLLGTIAKRTDADVNVIALIGERGREVKDFIEHSLGPEGLKRSVVVVATGDESPLLRIRAAKVACSAAEFFRSRGSDVMLMMDSVTRFAQAQRQVGLSVGEPPATKGYTPSVFAAMALLLERAGAIEATGAGTSQGGSVTGLYTILVEGDDMTEPIADAARGILDGHLMLSRKLAQRAHYPAVDVLDSISRVADEISDREHIAARQALMRMMAVYKEVEDLVQIGAYAKGSNPEADVAIEYHPAAIALLRQGRDESEGFNESRNKLIRLGQQAGESFARLMKARGR